tara:strand:+ start:2106 stop:2351 length:246 start_codon:yes stop_codon:yes gene_type:complete
MSEPVVSGLDITKQAAIDFFSDNNPVLKSMNLSMKDATKLGAIIIILVILAVVFRTTLFRIYNWLKGFIKRNMPSLNFLLI